MKTYKVYDVRDPRKRIFVRAKSGVQAIKKATKWINIPMEYMKAERL